MKAQQHRDALQRALSELVHDDELDLPTTIALLEQHQRDVANEINVASEAGDRQESEGGQ